MLIDQKVLWLGKDMIMNMYEHEDWTAGVFTQFRPFSSPVKEGKRKPSVVFKMDETEFRALGAFKLDHSLPVEPIIFCFLSTVNFHIGETNFL